MKIINAVAVPTNEKKTIGYYDWPVYVTSARVATYVITANLNMESEDSDPNKWILSGTCLLMSDDWGTHSQFIYQNLLDFFKIKLYKK